MIIQSLGNILDQWDDKGRYQYLDTQPYVVLEGFLWRSQDAHEFDRVMGSPDLVISIEQLPGRIRAVEVDETFLGEDSFSLLGYRDVKTCEREIRQLEEHYKSQGVLRVATTGRGNVYAMDSLRSYLRQVATTAGSPSWSSVLSQ